MPTMAPLVPEVPTMIPLPKDEEQYFEPQQEEQDYQSLSPEVIMDDDADINVHEEDDIRWTMLKK